jgi:hypothetical protein
MVYPVRGRHRQASPCFSAHGLGPVLERGPGAAVPRYIDAFLGNIRWDEVDRRLEHGLAAAGGWGS